jgi:AraC-like DNA-binding protein
MEETMLNPQHRMLTEMDPSGFGVKYEDNLSSYTPPHWHKEVELLLFVKGRVTCNFENTSRQFKRGDLYILNSHEVHETRCSRGARYLVVHIDPAQMVHYAPTFDHLRFSLVHDPEDMAKAMGFEQLRSHMKEILRLTEESDAVSRLERQARLFAVTAILTKHFAQPLALEETRLRRSDMSRLEPLLEYIQLHHGEELPLDEAVDFMGLNKEYFCRLFKKNMGVSYLQYVYQVRATAVCRELETTEDPIGEIAERHGFRDPKMLNQYFREIYGCTPSEKRKFFREVTVEDSDEPEDD